MKKYQSKKNKKRKIEGKLIKKARLLAEVKGKMQQQAGAEISLNEVIIALCEHYSKSFPLIDDQNTRLEELVGVTKRSREYLLNSIVEMGLKYYASKWEKAQGMSKQALRDSFSSGSAHQRIDDFVKKLMKKNDNAKEAKNKVHINQTYLLQHQGSNRGAIKAYLEVNKEMLDKHHAKHGLGPRHNFSVNSYHKRMEGIH